MVDYQKDSSATYIASFTLPTQVGHLPSCSFAVQTTTLVRDVFEELEHHPDYPGVVILEGKKCLGMISRQRCFEQLGQPFGIEIFLRRPVRTMFEKVSYSFQPIRATTLIEQAVQIALRRPIEQVYEPILVAYEDQQVRMVNLHDLLLAHARLLVNANQMIQKQMQIEQDLFTALEWDDVHQKIFSLVHEMVPYDRALLLLEDSGTLHITAARGFHGPNFVQSVRSNSLEAHVFQEIKVTRHPLLTMGNDNLRDLSFAFQLDPPKYWLGLPLVRSDTVIGMLALSRLSGKNFLQEEVTIGVNFCHQAAIALQNANRYNQSFFSALP